MNQTTQAITDLSSDQLAFVLKRLREKKILGNDESIPARPRAGLPLPLSAAQQRMWFLDQLDPATATYNIAAAVHMVGDLDDVALERSLDQVVRRHEVLRTVFTAVSGEPIQQSDAGARPRLVRIDEAAVPEARRSERLEQLLRQEARRPFDLSRGPLLRAVLVNSSPRHYVLVLVMHHIVADGWSCDVLVREIAQAYGDLTEGREPVLPDLPIQYADYAAWQREELEGERARTALDYFTEQLAGLDNALELPTDRPRPALLSADGAQRQVDLGAAFARGVDALAKRFAVTPFMVLLAGWNVLLGRYSGRFDLAVASPVANRTRAELEPMIGFFANTLVLRVDQSGDPTVADLLSRVKGVVNGAMAHQELPFGHLVEALEGERSLSRSPLAQVMLVVENAPLLPELPGLSVELEALGTGTAKLDLLLHITRGGEGLRGFLEYSTDLFDAATCDRLLAGFGLVLEEMIADPTRRLSQLSPLTADERSLFEEWNDTGRTIAAEQAIHHLFEAQVALTPEAEALVAGQQRLTYAELEGAAERLARRLRRHGVGPDVAVAVVMERSARLIVSLLAVLKAGGAYVPIDPGYPRDRVAFLLADSGAGLALTQAKFSALFEDSRIAVLNVEDLEADPDEGDRVASPAARAENLAYVIYTSGSTGRPKGVAITHASAAQLLDWAGHTFAADELGGMLAATSVSFDLSVFEIFAPLVHGGKVVLAENALALAELPAAGEVRLINTVPSAMTELVNLSAVPATVTTVNLAGEALAGDLVRRIYAETKACRVLNLYGPSEDTTYSTGTRIACDGNGEPTIGRPLPNTRAHLLDADLQPVPLGVPGELWLASSSLARGYLRRPALTAERFVPDPHSLAAAGRMYRTGDLARYLVSGELDFLGRLDHQVKLRGFRIELGEIEAALRRHREISQAVVMMRRNPEGRGDRLVAYVTGEQAPAASELRRFLATSLSEYMIPAAFVVLEALPLTPNGKVDRQALGSRLDADAASGLMAKAVHVAPRNPTEELLANIWTEVLGAERIGVHDNFFERGGHSLLAARVAARVGEALEIEVPVRRIFESPTPADLAEYLGHLGGDEQQAPAPVPTRRIDRQAEVPLSFEQERLWFLHQLDPRTAVYNLPAGLWLRGALDHQALERGLAEVESRHEALRTRFVPRGGSAVQVVRRPVAQPSSVVDLRLVPKTSRRDSALRMARDEGQRLFDLESGQVWRSRLYRTGEDEHLLVVVVHHIVADGTSLEVILRDLEACYAAFAVGEELSLPAPLLHYGEYASWQREWLVGERLEERLLPCRERLAGAPEVLELPTDRPRPARLDSRGNHLSVALPESLTVAVENLGREQGMTPFMVFLAAYALLLSRYSGQDDILIGSPVANRPRSEFEGLVGFFANTLVLRGRTADSTSFLELLAAVRAESLAALSRQDLPLAKLIEELRPEREHGTSPLFQVAFSWGEKPPAPRFADLGAEHVELTTRTSKFDLMLALRRAEDGCQGFLEYRTELFERATMKGFVEYFTRLLASAVAEPERRLEDLDVAGGEELCRWREARFASQTLTRASAQGQKAAAAFKAPRNPVEEVVAEIWAEILETERVGVDDDFFALGGHSLLAAQVVSRLAGTFATELSLTRLFETPTVAGLARVVEEARSAGQSLPSAPPLRPRVGRPEGEILSFAQERLWFLEQLDPGDAALAIPALVRLRGSLDRAALDSSLVRLVERHEILRTAFLSVDGEPVQQVRPSPEAAPRFLFTDLSHLDESARQIEVERLTEEEAGSLDLSQPLLRTRLLRHGDEEHLLLFVVHHIVADGWSMRIMVRELAALYAEMSSGVPAELAPPALQYADYALWQREWLRGNALDTQVAYWKEQLAGELPVLELPSDRPRPALQTYRAGRSSLVLESRLTASLRALSRREGVTVFMTLLASFKILLQRLSGQDDVVVGSPIAGRNQTAVEDLIGIFLNTLALRTDLAGNPSFCQLMARVRETTLGAYVHQDVPFEKLLAEILPERDTGRTPIFQVFFNMLNFPGGISELPGLTIEEIEAPDVASKFDLTIYIRESDAAMRLEWVYNADLFDAARIEEMAVQFRGLLEQAVTWPEASIDSLSLVTSAARVVLPDPAAPLEEGFSGLVHERVAEHARRRPEHAAVIDEAGVWTYGDLDRLAGRLAATLRCRGVGRGDVVAVYGHRSAPLAVAVLGIHRLGAVLLIQDGSYPEARLRSCLDEVRPIAWLEIEAAGQVPEALVEYLETSLVDCRLALPATPEQLEERLAELSADGADVEADIEICADDLAYVMFTSGTTGKPRGVRGTHRPLSHFLGWHVEQHKLRGDDRFSLLAGLSHDPLLRDLMTPLWLGATLIVPDAELILEPGWLAGWLAREKVSVTHLTPALGRLVTESGDVDLSSLRYAFFGGDVLTGDVVEGLRQLAPTVAAVNFYGATETPQAMAFCQVSGGVERRVPIGRGIEGVQILIEGRPGRLAGIGELGEVIVRTPYLAEGYWNDEALTRERFPTNPLAEGSGRVYRTGDLGRYLADGQVEIVGRADAQINLRGYRIEPAEVEGVLARHPAVDKAAVAAVEGEHGVDRLVGFVTGAGPVDELVSWLGRCLPAYMVPSSFAVIEQWPLTPNGKIDRVALSRLAADSAGPAAGFVAPRDAHEAAVAQIWCEILGLDTVGIHDNFFALGGHSLLATRLVGRLRRTFECELSLRALFTAPTVAELAAEIENSRGDLDPRDTLLPELPEYTPQPAERHLPFPLTDIQQAYWVGRKGAFDLGNVASHRYLEVESTELDLDRLTRVCRLLVKRHDMLRAVVRDDGKQQILEQVPDYEIAVADLRGQGQEAVEAELAAMRERMSHQVMDVSTWPLFEVRAAHIDDGGRVRLFLSFDYLIADAWSFRILQSEFLALYSHEATELPPLEFSFRDYVLAQIGLRETERYRRSREYWWNRLDTLPAGPELPLERDPATLSEQHFKRHSYRLDPSVWQQLKRRAAAAGLTSSGVLLCAFSEVLATWSKTSHFSLVLTLFNRLPVHPQVRRILGDFTSTTLLEVERRSEESFEQRARRLQAQLWSDLDHRYVSGVEVVRALGQRRGQQTQVATPIVFTSTLDLPVLEDSDDSLPVPGESIYGISQTPQVLLDHQVTEVEGGLHFNWDAVEEAYPAGLLGEMFTAYRALVERLASDEKAWRESYQNLVPASQLLERARVNATTAPIPGGLLHDHFLLQARRQPERPAVIAPDQSLTYGELLQRSICLGRQLREMGARPNTLVAIVMEKGWEQVVAALGILQSGAAYLPIDPALPAERFRYLLQHAEVELAVTQPWLTENLDWPDDVVPLMVESAAVESAAVESAAVESAVVENAVAESAVEPVQKAQDLAYVIFTSGSTGLPKGVMIDHRGALNTVVDVNQRFFVGAEDRVLALSALNFDLSVYDLFGPLSVGGAIVMPSAAKQRDPDHWLELLELHRVSLWNTVPALLEMLVSLVEAQGEKLPADMRVAMMSGDWIPVTLPERLHSLGRDLEVISLGGATEASIWSILYPIGEVNPDWASIPYGTPMVNQGFHVLDQALEPRPTWVPGDLYIAGIGLAKGYWRDVEKTDASFFHHPRTGQRLYRTGDLGRYLPGGVIEFLGREDFQVKVNGYRIELGEIEAVLTQHPSVRAAVATAVGPSRGNKRLVGYVVAEADGEANFEELRRFLNQKLPAYMVPATFVELDRLPLSANGKVDRRELPAPEQSQSVGEAPHVSPRTPVEEMLADITTEVLELDQIGVHDNFFELGGNSVGAILLISRVRETFQADVPLAKLFETPTIAGLAAEILEYQTQQENDEDMAQLLAELEDLPEDEISRLLAVEAEEVVAS